MRTINVFISQPMNGRQTKFIVVERYEILKNAKQFLIENKLMGKDDLLVDVNSDWDKPADESAGRLYYLGRSIQAMDKADFIIFGEGWSEARGCRVEETVAHEYYNYNLLNPFNEGLLAPNIDHIWFGKKG